MVNVSWRWFIKFIQKEKKLTPTKFPRDFLAFSSLRAFINVNLEDRM